MDRRRFRLILASLAIVMFCAAASVGGEVVADPEYNGCSEWSPYCPGTHTLCCVVDGKGECINNATSTCVECANSQRTICPHGQECCTGAGDCFDPNVHQCCAYSGNIFVCGANNTCCADACCEMGMACTHELECIAFPPEPKCGMACEDDRHCGAGGSECGTCVAFYTNPYNGHIAKICMANVEVPPSTNGPQAFTAQAGNAYLFNYSSPSDLAAVIQFRSDSQDSCMFTGLQYGGEAGIFGTLNNTIYVNIQGVSLSAGAGVAIGVDLSQNDCQISGEYASSTTTFPTASLDVTQGGQWSGSVSSGQLLTFLFNGGNSIDGLQTPFVVNVTKLSGNCEVVIAPSLGSSPSGYIMWQNGMTDLSAPISLYGGPFPSEWLEILFVNSGSCVIRVTSEVLGIVDMSTGKYEFQAGIESSYVACDSSGALECTGFTIVGSGPTTDSSYCLTATTSCSVNVNGEAYDYGVTLQKGETARIDIYSHGDLYPVSSCFGEILTTPGYCEESEMGYAKIVNIV